MQYKCLSEYYRGKTYLSEKVRDVNYVSSVSLSSAITVHRFIHVPDDLSLKLLTAFGIITSEENFREQRKPLWGMILNSEHGNSDNFRET